MAEFSQTSPNAAFMDNGRRRIDVTTEGAAILEGFMASHQYALDYPEQGMRNIDGIAVLVNDGTVISVIMRNGEGREFMVTATTLSDLQAGKEPKVDVVPYGLQLRDGFMRARTDRGVLKYSSHGRVELVDPDDSDSLIPTVKISSLLASRAEADNAALLAIPQETSSNKSSLLPGLIGRLATRYLRRK